ncbi:M23 family metallopeptidase [Fulvivirgaceae bacterium BMA10]|uniref:M23 family metallopeptidase n=1 Tax=Splendidivirga corallicola TaxID=3051826 RepID=A0ABT8KVN7_9BACT|nr:M23 family metallopeptidase [Fulvivirgaceae bacterium BMA10]
MKLQPTIYLSIILITTFLTQTTVLFGQNPIKISYERDENKGSYVFYCENSDVCSYIVEIRFDQLVNLRASRSLPFKGTVQRGRTKLFELNPVAQNQSTSLNYSYSYRKGCLRPKVDWDLLYLLPVAKGNKTKVSELSYLGERFGNEKKSKNWYALSFGMSVGDTVYAARKGIVVEVIDHFAQDGDNIIFARDRNYVQIEHEDCTYGQYELFRKNGIFVEKGDFINPGDPLGIIGGKNYQTGDQLRFSVFYADEYPIEKDGNAVLKKNYWTYVPLKFHVKGGTTRLLNGKEYESEHVEEIIIQEMSKKERKRWMKE